MCEKDAENPKSDDDEYCFDEDDDPFCRTPVFVVFDVVCTVSQRPTSFSDRL